MNDKQLVKPFNPSLIDIAYGDGQLPVGNQTVVICNHRIQQTQQGDGGMLVLILKTVGGENDGVQGPLRLNLYHPEARTTEFAEKDFARICHAVGMGQSQISAVEPLYNKPFDIRVEWQDSDDHKYTEIKQIGPVGTLNKAPAQSSATQAQSTQVTAETQSQPSWGSEKASTPENTPEQTQTEQESRPPWAQ